MQWGERPGWVGEGAADAEVVGVETVLLGGSFADDGWAEVVALVDVPVELVAGVVLPSPPPRACALAFAEPGGGGGGM